MIAMRRGVVMILRGSGVDDHSTTMGYARKAYFRVVCNIPTAAPRRSVGLRTARLRRIFTPCGASIASLTRLGSFFWRGGGARGVGLRRIELVGRFRRERAGGVR